MRVSIACKIIRGIYSRHGGRKALYNLNSGRHASSLAASTVDSSATPVSSTKPGLVLRDYQEACIETILSYVKQGQKRLGVSLATGSGKTMIVAHLIDRLPRPSPKASQTLIVAHRRELVEQAARQCINVYPHKSVEIEMGASHASGLADITITSIQSVNSGDRMAKFDPDHFKLVIVDEAHHIVARQYLNLLEHFGLRHPSPLPSPALVGVSATFSRSDGVELGAAIDHIVFHKDYVDMIDEKWLSNVIFTTVDWKVDLSHVKIAESGNFVASSLSKQVNTEQANEVVVRSWLARAQDRKSTLVFCVDLAHVSALAGVFRRHEIDARFITSNTPKSLRSERLNAFKRGEYSVLLNCGIFTEGTDIPNIDCIILARPTRSRNLLVQMIGRGMRLHTGKANCHVIDMVASLKTGIVTTPTLFGLNPDELVRSADARQMNAMRDKKVQEGQMEEVARQGAREAANVSINDTSVTFTDYDTVADLIEDTSGERHIRAISQLAWVQVGEQRYILSCQTGGHLLLYRQHDMYEVRYTAKAHGQQGSSATKVPFLRPRTVAQAETFADAVHAADRFAAVTFTRIFILATAKWRTLPATEAQIKFLNRFRDASSQLNGEHITKGRANDMITKVRHGAKGWFNKLTSEKRAKRRSELSMGKWEALQQREHVSVGSLDGDNRLRRQQQPNPLEGVGRSG